MWSFLRDFAQHPARPKAVVLFGEVSSGAARHHSVVPARILMWWAASLVGTAVATALVVAFTSLGGALTHGPVRAEIEQSAVRVAALQDSLGREAAYRLQLRQLMTGQIDSVYAASALRGGNPRASVSGELAAVAATPRTGDWRDHDEAASMQHAAETPLLSPSMEDWYLPRLQFPVRAPVEGFVTRGFDARSGHFAVDVAVPMGTPVQSIGPGHVIMADQTREGGAVIAVQHAGGYVAVYKHNRKLRKRVGDRVEAREPIAETGNSGETTTGPHLHVELWHGGLAQDPARFMIGW